MLALAWAVLTGALIGLGMLVTHSGPVQSFDDHVTSLVTAHRSATLDTVMKAVTWLGSWVALAVTAVTVVVLVARKRLSIVFAVLSLALWAGTQGATTLAKRVVHRPRPPAQLGLVTTHGWSWPSGHAASASVVFGILTAVVWAVTPRPLLRRLAALFAFVAVVSVAFSRVELGVHWCTDVLAGVAFVLMWSLIVGAVSRPSGSRSGGDPPGEVLVPEGGTSSDSGSRS